MKVNSYENFYNFQTLSEKPAESIRSILIGSKKNPSKTFNNLHILKSQPPEVCNSLSQPQKAKQNL